MGELDKLLAEHEAMTERERTATTADDARTFKRELFMRLYTAPGRDLTDTAFCWAMAQRAWEHKPDDC